MNDGKTIAIISYITAIGTIIAFFMNNNQRNAFAAFHIRQTLGLSLFSMINTFLLARFIGGYAVAAISLGIFILWVFGFVGAIQGQTKKIPLFGDIFQDWFKTIA